MCSIFFFFFAKFRKVRKAYFGLMFDDLSGTKLRTKFFLLLRCSH